MKRIVIFGAGELGMQAYEFYSKQYNVACFIDNDRKKWNSSYCGIPIKSPNTVKNDSDTIIVVPSGAHKNEMCAQLKKAGVNEIVLFEVVQQVYTPYLISDMDVKQEELIIGFEGGLGNQIFQYAFMRYMMMKGRNCSVDLSYYIYPYAGSFCLCDVFKKARIVKCNPYLREKYLSNAELHYEESDIRKYWIKPSENSINDSEYGHVSGFFQTNFYVNNIQQVLSDELQFPLYCDSGMEKYLELMEKRNAVAVHVRRGDYLSKENNNIFGNICTDAYYLQAIETMARMVENPLFIFFSNEIEWVRKNFPINDAIYVCQSDFNAYEDWYDLYLMSKCKHNIIANSSFSWWGAWLNNYKNRQVIAPQKWVNYDALTDICPEEWIRI